MDADSLATFRLVRMALGAVDAKLDAETAELRDEVHALTNRVEALTRAVLAMGTGAVMGLHSVRVPDDAEPGMDEAFYDLPPGAIQRDRER